MYDLIVDIHGHADDLVQLLEALGYYKNQGVFSHPDRKVIFLGDFIDRGPQIRQVLELVRPMVETGRALAVMGNHEFNALAYHSADPTLPGEYLRRHTDKNVHQHRKTVEQLTPEELASHLAWFRTLPMWLDLDGLRAVHACWDENAIRRITIGLQEHDGISPEFLKSACRKGDELFKDVEIILKGKEAALPDDIFFLDKDGQSRTAVRTRWYLPPQGHTYQTYALQTDPIHCELKLTASVIAEAAAYPATAKPVFVGHYWLSAGWPKRLAPNVACLDYSVAKGGFLCAYRWSREQVLNDEHFVRAS